MDPQQMTVPKKQSHLSVAPKDRTFSHPPEGQTGHPPYRTWAGFWIHQSIALQLSQILQIFTDIIVPKHIGTTTILLIPNFPRNRLDAQLGW